MRHIRDQAKDDAYEAGLHRRREGAFWLGVGGGLGWGFSPAGRLEWESQIQVSAITTTTGMFHILPELGWMYSDGFALALQARIEFIKQQQGTWHDPSTDSIKQISPGWMTGAPTTKALAVFGRAIGYTDLSASGNFQFSYSGDIGGGFVRFPVLPSNIRSDSDLVQDKDGNLSPRPSSAIALTDTRPVGPFLLGASAGIIYHISRHFALVLDGRFLAGLPKFGALLEGGLSVQVAIGGVAGPAPVGEEGEGEGGEGGGPVNDAPPPPADSPPEPSESEE